ncbi:uncharacterized protein [Nicotiana sylvestris]|uniref:uncharacterized protein isoform X8 n=1 Tax=Nicotiana sylvestris TaxID=4096 RepID=UPI00388CA282
MAPKNLSFKIILGSSSMARRKILADMGYDFTVMTADIDEKSIRKENAEELVVALAEAKADAIMSRLETTDHLEENTHPTLLITADTVCLFLHIAREYFKYHDLFGYILPTSIGIEVAVYQGIIREKPSSKEEARQFIKRSIGNNLSTCTRLLWWSSHGCGICCGDQPHKGDKKRSLGKCRYISMRYLMRSLIA